MQIKLKLQISLLYVASDTLLANKISEAQFPDLLLREERFDEEFLEQTFLCEISKF